MIKKVILLLLIVNTLNAQSMFLLSKIKKVYPIVENYSSHVSMDIKEDLLESIKDTMKELKVDTKGYDPRAFGLIIQDSSLNGLMVINIELVLGEEVQRLDDKKNVYAITYLKRKQIVITKSDSLENISEQVTEISNLLLSEFEEQYYEDNKAGNFKAKLNYETSYKVAIKKAKENKKYIPLVLNKEEGHYPKKYITEMVPIVYFIDYKTENIKEKIIGYNSREDFLNIINK